MSSKYVIFSTKEDIDDVLFFEVKKKSNVLITNIFDNFNVLEKNIHKVHQSKKLNRIINLPNKKIWFKKYFDINNYNKDDRIIFIYLNNTCFIPIENGFISYLKENFPKSKHVYYALDIFGFRNSSYKSIKHFFDASYIFDEIEAKNNNLSYYPLPYSKLNLACVSDKIKYADVCFVGYAKTRYSKLIEIFEFCKKNNLTTNFYILGIEKAKQLYKNEIHYVDFVPYSQTIEILMKSNCDIELYVDGCTSYSQRVMSAIVYNKKLITNNKNVINSPFVTEDIVKYFDNTNGIDVSFIKSKCKKSHMTNIFSPVLFLEELERRLYNDKK